MVPCGDVASIFDDRMDRGLLFLRTRVFGIVRAAKSDDGADHDDGSVSQNPTFRILNQL